MIFSDMTREEVIGHILGAAGGIANLVEDYDEENLDLFMRAPDAVLQKMASVLTEAFQHLDQHLSVFAPEFDKIKQEDYDDD